MKIDSVKVWELDTNPFVYHHEEWHGHVSEEHFYN
jgi:hypothetical protein